MMALGLAMKNVQDQKLEMNGDTLMASLRALSFDGLSDARIWPRVQTTAIMAVEIMNCQGYKEDGKTVRFVPVGFVDSVTGKLTIEEGQNPLARQDQYSAQSLIRRNRFLQNSRPQYRRRLFWGICSSQTLSAALERALPKDRGSDRFCTRGISASTGNPFARRVVRVIYG